MKIELDNYWKIPGVPHKGWELHDVIDLAAEGCSYDEYETCMMCGNEHIRYVHIVSHPEVQEDFRAGCVCAEKMTGDYVNPKRMENQLRNRATRRINWANSNWNRSKKKEIFTFEKTGIYLRSSAIRNLITLNAWLTIPLVQCCIAILTQQKLRCLIKWKK